MPATSVRRVSCALAALPALLAGPRPAWTQEFVRQQLIVTTFRSATDMRAARRLTEELRSRVWRLSNHRELDVVDGDMTARSLERSGFDPDQALDDRELALFARTLRVDEVLFGSLIGRGAGFEGHAQLALMRDWRQRQPLPAVRGASTSDVADGLAREATQARAQMPGLRRCENALRAGDWALAAREAEGAVRAYPPSVFARTCLLSALMQSGVRADSVRTVAEAVLAVDSVNILAAVTRAQALETLQRVDDAAATWSRVTEMRPDSLELVIVGVEQLMRLQRLSLALAASRKLLSLHEREPRIRRLAFRAHISLSQWKEAAALGDSLFIEDPDFRADSSYGLRYVEALKQSGDTIGALAASAREVRRHGGDMRLYLQYVQLLGAEQASALARGTVRFPDAAEFYVLQSNAARSAGKRTEAIAALEGALARDPLLAQGFLQLAELWFEEKRADSALAALARAPRTGVSASTLRAYTAGRGGQLLRAAGDTAAETQRLAIAFFALADSVDSRDDTRSYVASASLQLARSELLTASRTRGCADVRRADEALAASSDALGRGVASANGGDQLKLAWDAMRSAVDNAAKTFCKGQR